MRDRSFPHALKPNQSWWSSYRNFKSLAVLTPSVPNNSETAHREDILSNLTNTGCFRLIEHLISADRGP